MLVLTPHYDEIEALRRDFERDFTHGRAFVADEIGRSLAVRMAAKRVLGS